MKSLFLFAAALAALPQPARAGERSIPAPGDTIPAFDAHDAATGAAVPLAGAKVAVVAFSGKGCPIASAHAPRLAELESEFAPRGARFLLVNSNAQEDAAEFAAFAKAAGVAFPVVIDADQRLADLFGVTRTGEVVLLDSERRVVYRGAVDDQFGVGSKKPDAQRHFLREALEAALDGRVPATRSTSAAGCLLARAAEKRPAPAGSAEYHRDVAPILRKHCVECHRPGEVGPFPLLSYRDADGWSLMIREVVEAGLMPPWHADPRYGRWSNARALSDAEKKTILDWVDAGAPEGPPPASEPPLPPADPGRWHIGTPDLVIKAPKQSVPARGEIDYRYAQVDTGLTEDRWVSAAEIHAGARSIVHHILVFVRYPRERQSEQPPIDGGLEAGYFACLVPGERPNVWPEGTAKLLPKGSKLVFQLHYTANGTPQEDESEIGLVFAKEAPRRVVTTRGINHRAIRIPPGEPNATFTTFWKPKSDVTLLSFMPHMHFRGKSFRYEAEYPDGRSEILLDVPRYDFNWQATYRFAEPKEIPGGSKLRVTAVFDNSPGNPANPDPTKTVRWGDQTWDEMLIGYVDFVEK